MIELLVTFEDGAPDSSSDLRTLVGSVIECAMWFAVHQPNAQRRGDRGQRGDLVADRGFDFGRRHG